MARPAKTEKESMKVCLPKPMVEQIDKLVEEEMISRSAFIRRAVVRALAKANDTVAA